MTSSRRSVTVPRYLLIMAKSFICKICNTTIKGYAQFLIHLHECHSIQTIVDYCISYVPLMCKECGKQSLNVRKHTDTAFIRYGNAISQYCSNKCKMLHASKHVDRHKPHSAESKEKCRIARLKQLQNTAFAKPWYKRHKRQLSKLEAWFADKILEHNLEHQYDIANEYTEYPYSIDFAFLNCKIAVELDGQMHFKNPGAYEHDIKKTNHLTSCGWHVFRIAFYEANDVMFDNFLDFLKSVQSNPKVLQNRIVNYHEACEVLQYQSEHTKCKCISKQLSKSDNITKQSKVEQQKQDIAKVRRLQLLKSSIDLTKRGWCVKVAQLWNVKSQHVRHYMQKYMPDLLDNAKIRRK